MINIWSFYKRKLTKNYISLILNFLNIKKNYTITRRWPVPTGGNSFEVVTKIPNKGRGPATPFGESDMLEKYLKIILDHYLLDAKIIMQKYSTVEHI